MRIQEIEREKRYIRIAWIGLRKFCCIFFDLHLNRIRLKCKWILPRESLWYESKLKMRLLSSVAWFMILTRQAKSFHMLNWLNMCLRYWSKWLQPHSMWSLKAFAFEFIYGISHQIYILNSFILNPFAFEVSNWNSNLVPNPTWKTY